MLRNASFLVVGLLALLLTAVAAQVFSVEARGDCGLVRKRLEDPAFLRTFVAADFDECRDTCLRSLDCISFSFQRDSGSCVLYKQTLNSQRIINDSIDRGRIWYNRRCFERSSPPAKAIETVRVTRTETATSTTYVRSTFTTFKVVRTDKVPEPEPTPAGCPPSPQYVQNPSFEIVEAAFREDIPLMQPSSWTFRSRDQFRDNNWEVKSYSTPPDGYGHQYLEITKYEGTFLSLEQELCIPSWGGRFNLTFSYFFGGASWIDDRPHDALFEIVASVGDAIVDKRQLMQADEHVPMWRTRSIIFDAPGGNTVLKFDFGVSKGGPKAYLVINSKYFLDNVFVRPV